MKVTFKNHESTILIVDDMPANLKVLFAYLRQLNFRVLIAEDGEDALEKVRYTQPDLILLDIMMPDMDGFETCQLLKQSTKTRDIPIIFISALDEVVDKVKGFELGAVDYISKPFQCDEVLVRINLHLEINYVHQQLRKKNDELKAFSHTVAHDLKNPLNAIRGFSELLDEACEASEYQDFAEYIYLLQQANHEALNIIDSLLLLAGIDNEKAHLEPLNMPELIERSIQQLSHFEAEYQPDIRIQAGNWETVIGQAQWVQAIWVNYLSNAIKYGGRPPVITIGNCEDSGGQIKFWVKDNGNGLSLEEQKQLFIPFTHIGKRCKNSHGLGLSIVQRITERCNGFVGVESVVGQGSLFYFTLPRQ